MTRSGAKTLPVAPVRLQVRRPEDLLALVPYLLGFQPTESLVAVLVGEGRVRLTVRVDLPADEGEDLVGCVQDLVDRHAPGALVLIVYCPDRERAEPLLRRHLDALTGVSITDALLVDGHRWWSLSCTGDCCPAEGTPYVPQVHPLAAEAVYAGLTARASREEVAAQVAGPKSQWWDAPRRVAEDLRGSLRRLGRAGRRQRMASEVVNALALVAPGRLAAPPDPAATGTTAPTGTHGGAAPTLDERRLIGLALLAQEVMVRDVACALITQEQASAHQALWHRVVAATPPELAVPPLCLLGVAAWAGGEGALLNCCCERVRALDPTYSMGRLLADVSARALPPSFWDALSAQMRRELGLAAR